MASFSDRIKGAFFETTPDPVSSSKSGAPTAPMMMPPSGNYIAPMSTGLVIDPQLAQHFATIVAKRRTPYTSLVEASEKLRPVLGADDSKRLQAAFVMQGGDKAEVLKAIDIHTNDLDSEAANFQTFARSETSTKVDTLKQQAEQLANAAEADLNKVKDLTQEIQSLQQASLEKQAQASKATSDARNAQNELDQKAAAFTAALAAAKSNLAQQKAALNTILQ
jgi:hypothetical protein